MTVVAAAVPVADAVAAAGWKSCEGFWVEEGEVPLPLPLRQRQKRRRRRRRK
jgi:hypothetical protein